MATSTLSVSWHSIYRRTNNSGAWKGGHSNGDNNNRYYHGGTSASGGNWNGNMCTLISMHNAKEKVKELGSRVTSVKLKIWCDWCFNHGSGAYIDICVGSSSPSGKTATSLSGLGWKRIHSAKKVNEGRWYEFNIPVSDVKNHKYVILYREGSYNHSDRYCYFNVENGRFSSTYASKLLVNYNAEVIPGIPSLKITHDGNESKKTLTPESGATREYRVFAGTKSTTQPGNNSECNMTFTITPGHSEDYSNVHLQWKRANTSWTYAAGYPKEFPSNNKITRNFYVGEPKDLNSNTGWNAGDRYGHGKTYWRAWVRTYSSTGDYKPSNDYLYFVYNDCPYPTSDPWCELSGSSIVRLHLPTVNIGEASSGYAYHYVMYQVNGGAWKTPSSHSLANKGHWDYTWDELGIEPGNSYRFCVAVGDSLEWNNHTWNYTPTHTRPILPAKPTLTISSANNRVGTYISSAGTNYKIFPGWAVTNTPGDKQVNTLTFTIGNKGDHGYKTVVEKWDGSKWVRHDYYYSGAQKVTYNVNDGTASNNYNSSDRWPHSWYRAFPYVESSTGHGNSGDYVYYFINDVPMCTNAYWNLSSDKKSAIIEWTWSDTHYNDLYAYVLAKIERGGVTTTVKPATHSFGGVKKATISLSSLGVKAGDRLSFSVRAGDTYEWNELHAYQTNTIKINTPPSLTGNISTGAANFNGYFGDTLYMSWPSATDVDGDSLYYKIRVSVDGKDYVTVDDVYSTEYTYTTAGINKGSRIKLAVRAIDPHGGLSEWIYSDYITKSSNPPKPTGLKINLANGHDDIAESIESLSWNDTYQANGNKVAHYNATVFYEKTSGVWSKRVASPVSPSMMAYNFNEVLRGGRYKFSVQAVDSFGYLSEVVESKIVNKNKLPSTPVNFKCTEIHDEIINKIGMSWNKSSDEDASTVTYSIEFSQNGGQYREVKTGIKTLSYTHDISKLAPGTKLAFRIRAKDRLGIYSSYANMDKNNIVTINYPPGPCTKIYPKTPIYAKEPRICFKIGTDRNNHRMTAHVTVNGRTYSSDNSSHRKYFNERDYSSGQNASFCLTGVELPIGKTVFTVKVKDHLEYSDPIGIYYERIAQKVDIIRPTEDRIITSVDIKNLYAMAKSNEAAYREERLMEKDDFIKHIIFLQIKDAVSSTQQKLNNDFKGFSRLMPSSTIIRHGAITKAIFNSILDGIFKP